MGSGTGDSSPRRFQGLPLVEVVLVVLLVGILAAVAVPNFLNQERKAVDASMALDLRAIASQLEAYRLDHGAYPAAGATPAEAGFDAPTLRLGEETVALTPGNTPRIFARGRDRVCIQVTNPGSTVGRVWKADAGGLQASGTTCAGYRTVVL